MNWYWVRCYFTGTDGYNDESWQLWAAENEQHIHDSWKWSNYKALEIVPYTDRPVPPTPRKTKRPRNFDPRLQQP